MIDRAPARRARMEVRFQATAVDGSAARVVEVHHPAHVRQMWWRFEAAGRPLPAPRTANFAAVAALPWAMAHATDLHVRGLVDRTFLENLEELVDVWVRWRPDLFHRIRIDADDVMEGRPSGSEDAVLMFSGGVDATFALAAHVEGLLGHRSRPVSAGLLVRGFDVPLHDDGWWSIARDHGQHLLGAFGVPLWTCATNWREFSVDWEMGFGMGIAAVLHQCEASIGLGLWAADESYDHEIIPWGSNSIVAPLLGSPSLPVRVVGGGYERDEKIGYIAHHEAVRRHLRVCWRQPANGLNCGRCEKCVRTLVSLWGAGYERCEAFEAPLTASTAARIRIGNQVQHDLLASALSRQASRLPRSVVAALRYRLARYRLLKTGWIGRLRRR